MVNRPTGQLPSPGAPPAMAKPLPLQLNRQRWMVVLAAWLGWGLDIFDGLLFNVVAPNAVPSLFPMAHHGEVLSLLGDIWLSLERVKLLSTLAEIAAAGCARH